jgi:uncharacterized membrane protein (UPF0182 family)
VVDPSVVSPTFKQLQAVKPYYQFADALDVDRYTLNNKVNDTVIAVRELELDGLPVAQRNWVNDHTVYTHGFGVVAAFGNQTEKDGQPVFYEQNIPPVGPLGKFEPRIYFGESSPDYSIVGGPANGPKKELDYPDSTDTGQQNNTYAGKGGVAIGDLARKTAYAIKYRELKILLSDTVVPARGLLDHRTPRERVERVAPWLTLDGNSYPAVVDGRVQWIIDGYTTRPDYPYSKLQADRQRDCGLGDGADHERPGAGRAGSTTCATRSRQPSTPLTAASSSIRGTNRTRCSRRGRKPSWHRASDVGDQRRPDVTPAVPRGPVQGPAQPDVQVPRHRPGRFLRRSGLLDDS